eukprot:CAMPEP_0201716954 /NCGR_PEP_ID=MMETSP0593-20130828/2818_1 /ASSEMBLY_ACC=CAM_ASM_000672 /TAXON_ID=267983 /ORGANISM="Skeletonema japonicum, Strain CCMP2506" /LENGTH=684 /DNA_ID=CAMNT_0048206895 /DNA_START=169 /DNA_END=2223 /DNA_ORIENTATION=-
MRSTTVVTTPPRSDPLPKDTTTIQNAQKSFPRSRSLRGSGSYTPSKTVSFKNSFTNNANTNENNGHHEQQQRRRSSASEITLEQLERTSIFCPLPKKGFFYSKAYKEHKKKRKQHRQQKSSGSDGGGGSSVDEEIPLKRDLTRRKRNSFVKRQPSEFADAHQLGGSFTGDKNNNYGSVIGSSGSAGGGGSGSGGGYQATNVTAYLAARVEAERPTVVERYSHAAMLLNGMSKSHMLDVALVGSDQQSVMASKFVLACYSPVLEEMFFKPPVKVGRKSETWLLWSTSDGVEVTGAERALVVDCCTSIILKAAVYFCFSGELPEDFDIEGPNETVARNLAQLDQFAYMYRVAALAEVTYRAARKLINKRPVLACAIFDELSYREGRGGGPDGMGSDSIKRYALDTMREMPMDTLLCGGVQWMKEDSVESIMQDQDLDVDEFYMFKILKAWGSVDDSERQAAARRMAVHIELKFIDPDLLKTQVKNAGYFEEKQIMEAVKLIEDSLADREAYEMERVLVEGAAKDIVNGIYVRVLDEVGMSEEEILFVKEADDGYSDVGLYLWKTKWNIAMCADYSNCFYSCKDDRQEKLANELVPRVPWVTDYGGEDPPPVVTYLPITRAGRFMNSGVTGGTVMAPNLEEMIDPTIAEKRRSGYFDRRTDDTAEKRTMTLEQMMNLPIDQGDNTNA